MKNYYCVCAKCGHVGKENYYRAKFYKKAEDAKSAAALVRATPRVKHHHKFAILSVEKIDFETYILGIIENMSNPYFSCHSKQEQKLFEEEIFKNVFPDEEYAVAKKIKQAELSTKNVYFGKERIKKPKKFIKLYDLSKGEI